MQQTCCYLTGCWLGRWLVSNKGFPVDQIASGPLQFFIFAVTIVVVAVPEGLPLAVTISLVGSHPLWEFAMGSPERNVLEVRGCGMQLLLASLRASPDATAGMFAAGCMSVHTLS